MKKFTVEFTVTETYSAEVDAVNRAGAVALFEANPDHYIHNNPDVETTVTFVS